MKKITDQMILKAVLMLRELGNKYQSKEEQIAEQKQWLADDPTYAERFFEWVDSMRADLQKTPEEREAESERIFDEMRELEAETEYQEWDYRDEWDDLWADRARSVGAVYW